MKTHEFIEEKREGLKNLGAIFWLLSKIDGLLITHISFFFTEWSKVVPLKSLLINRSLFDEKIFLTLESRRRLFKKIIEGLSDEATEKGIIFNKEKYISICKLIIETQEIRNVLAHNLVFFSDDGKTATYTDVRKINDTKRITLDLIKELEKADKISILLEENFADFVYDAQRVVNSPIMKNG
jgi:CRISPR/Cas system Type II protein with McrA/HNH and RuvC-like nuclease domain